MVIRNFVRNYIQQRKKGLNKSKFNNGQDFLDYLLADDYFSQNEILIVDEILDFFIAATQTTASTTQTILHFLTQSEKHQTALRNQVSQIVGESKSREELFCAFNSENT